MGRGYKGVKTWKQILVIWFAMMCWGGVIFALSWIVVVTYKLITGN
jgi:hypothetical protein